MSELHRFIFDGLPVRGILVRLTESCGLHYRFDPVDVGELFVAPADQAPGSSAIK